MDNDALDDLVRRLTALVVKIDERDTHMVERMERQDQVIERLDQVLAHHDAMLADLRAFTQEQVRINRRLETLMTEVFRERHNGHEA